MGSGGESAVVNVFDVSRSGSARSRPGGVGDVDRDAGDGGETGVLGHLAAPAPDDRGSHGPREAGDHDLQGSGNGAQVVAAVPTIRHEHTSAGEGGTHPSAKQLVLVNFGYLRIEDLIAQAPDMRRPATTGVSHTLGAICTTLAERGTDRHDSNPRITTAKSLPRRPKRTIRPLTQPTISTDFATSFVPEGMVNQLMQTAAIRAAGAHDLPAHLDITHQDEPLTQSSSPTIGPSGRQQAPILIDPPARARLFSERFFHYGSSVVCKTGP